MRKLGTTQQHVLNSLKEFGPYPGGGWLWDTPSNTMRILESLHRRHLVVKRSHAYYGTQYTVIK